MPDRWHEASSGAGIHSSTSEFPHSSLSVKTHSHYSQTTHGHSACHRNRGVIPACLNPAVVRSMRRICSGYHGPPPTRRVPLQSVRASAGFQPMVRASRPGSARKARAGQTNLPNVSRAQTSRICHMFHRNSGRGKAHALPSSSRTRRSTTQRVSDKPSSVWNRIKWPKVKS
jgi:hypothetical protein